MVSAIDPTEPVYGFPTTQSVRDNFQTAHDEITALQAATTGSPFLPIAGGEVTGNLQVDGILTVKKAVSGGSKLSIDSSDNVSGWSTLTLATNPAGTALIEGTKAGSPRWDLFLGDTTAESGSNTGSHFGILRYSDAGAQIDTPLRIFRNSGNMALGNASTDQGFRLDVTGTGRFSGLVTLTGGATSTGGTITVGSNTNAFGLLLNGPAGQGRNLRFQSGGLQRWLIAANSTGEGGSNAGSDLDFIPYDDTGATQLFGGTPVIRIIRSTGQVSINNPLRLNGTVGFNNTAPIAKPTVNGACAGNTAIKALLTTLASYGLLTDATTA